MTVTTYRYRVQVHVQAPSRGGGDMPGLLDMLRFDRPIVEDWARADEDDGYLLTLSTAKPLTIDRWASFGLYPKKVA